MNQRQPITLVTGASGFLGGAICRRLLAEGRPVRALSRSPMPALEKLGAETVRADIADTASLAPAMVGVGTVFHVAARVGVWGPKRAFEHTNIDGTLAVLEAARRGGVGRLVFTSSPSVVFNDRDLAGVDESIPLGTDFPAHYPRTKAEAERLALAAHRPDGLRVVALRPHLIFGPGDMNLLPRVVRRARAGRLRIVGTGKNRVDLTYIDNAVDAHLAAERALAAPESRCGGRAYFITNGEPVELWPWINALLARLGIPPVTRHLSLAAARRIGAVCEALWATGLLPGEPPMTRFVASELAKDHWFDITAARRDLGYEPRVNMADALEKTLPALREAIARPEAQPSRSR
ncbi:MAG: NAD-dependent epimerase/dehydratase family protein [Verrucomicrobia bacterium]|nr:MAG: NAD-dependent epimerase/dehydratase family protein [Verrucomicrobiota bacterium]